MLPSRRLPPSPPTPRSASPSKLSPLYAPLSPVDRGQRCRPCLLALVSTLGCFRPPPSSLLLLTSALSGSIIRGSVFRLKSKRSSFSRARLVTPKRKRHRLTHTKTLSLVPRQTRARAAEERRFTLVCTYAHEPNARSALKTNRAYIGPGDKQCN